MRCSSLPEGCRSSVCELGVASFLNASASASGFWKASASGFLNAAASGFLNPLPFSLLFCQVRFYLLLFS